MAEDVDEMHYERNLSSRNVPDLPGNEAVETRSRVAIQSSQPTSLVRSRSELGKTWEARRHNERNGADAYPWHHFWLPSIKPRNRTSRTTQGQSQSEDETPNKQRILGKDYRLPAYDQEVYRNSAGSSALDARQHELEATNPEVAPHSCNYCGQIQLDFRRNIAEANFNLGPEPDDGVGWSIKKIKTGVTLADAQEAAAFGCYFFRRLLSDTTDSSAYFLPHYEEQDKDISRWHSSMAKTRNGETHPILVSVTMAQTPQLEFMFDDVYGICDYEIYPSAGLPPPHSSCLERPAPNLLPNSELSYGRIRGWMRGCEENHAMCTSFTASFAPKRLLEISGTGSVPRIRLSKPTGSVRYATLSYCWGGDQPGKTLVENVRSYEVDIPYNTMPRTIQDAITVTRGIGMSYLWVDAICIIQDDDSDKFDQIGQMHSIYRSAWVTIAAAVTLKSTDGFLQPRSQWRPTKLKARFDDNVFSEVLISPMIDSLRDGTLFSRGWTFQETQLSTRILLYGHREMIYVCMEGAHSDGGNVPDLRSATVNVDPGNQIHGALQHPNSWGAIATRYSYRKLSFQADKLPGISALAQEYSRTKLAGRYFAGLWEKDFLRQCLWRPNSHPGITSPDEYRAPSWSWASIDGRIIDFDSSIRMTMGDLHILSKANTKALKATCNLVSVSTTLVIPNNPFGMVSGGSMVVSGKLRRLIWCHNTSYMASWGRMSGDTGENWVIKYSRQPQGADPRLKLFVDSPDAWPKGEDVPFWGLEMFHGNEREGFGLLLRNFGDENKTFQRAGMWTVFSLGNEENWLDKEYEFREITIL